MQADETVRAACLTPPGAGGIAVVQVIGHRAAEILSAHLQADRLLDLNAMGPLQLRLCRVVDNKETIDDAVVAARRDPAGQLVVDLNLHGGRRVVQRVLVMLERVGAKVVEVRDLLTALHDHLTDYDREAAEALLEVHTRPVAAWLARTIACLPVEVQQMVTDIQAGRIEEVRSTLALRCAAGERYGRLLAGVRVVLVGQPNTGKSTLANRLGGHERAIVSDTPGTTRDWTEHPGAVAGVPFTFVDTAGLRPTPDSIEEEAVRRSRDQVASADVVLRVTDASQPPTEEDIQAVEDAELTHEAPHLIAWNKIDLGYHPLQAILRERGIDRSAAVSALTGQGVDALHRLLIRVLGLEGWEQATVPFSKRQLAAYRSALAALSEPHPDPKTAARRLKSVISVTSPGEDG